MRASRSQLICGLMEALREAAPRMTELRARQIAAALAADGWKKAARRTKRKAVAK